MGDRSDHGTHALWYEFEDGVIADSGEGGKIGYTMAGPLLQLHYRVVGAAYFLVAYGTGSGGNFQLAGGRNKRVQHKISAPHISRLRTQSVRTSEGP